MVKVIPIDININQDFSKIDDDNPLQPFLDSENKMDQIYHIDFNGKAKWVSSKVKPLQKNNSLKNIETNIDTLISSPEKITMFENKNMTLESEN